MNFSESLLESLSHKWESLSENRTSLTIREDKTRSGDVYKTCMLIEWKKRKTCMLRYRLQITNEGLIKMKENADHMVTAEVETNRNWSNHTGFLKKVLLHRESLDEEKDLIYGQDYFVLENYRNKDMSQVEKKCFKVTSHETIGNMISNTDLNPE